MASDFVHGDVVTMEDGSTRKMERSEALARDKPGIYQHQREVENIISITMQSYTHVGWRHNGPGVTGAPL